MKIKDNKNRFRCEFIYAKSQFDKPIKIILVAGTFSRASTSQTKRRLVSFKSPAHKQKSEIS